jgi:cytochrome P450
MTRSEKAVDTPVPGPTRWHLYFWETLRRPLEFFCELQEQGPPVIRFRRGVDVYYLADPELIRELLVAKASSFHKGRGLQRAKIVLGEGLLTSEDQVHIRQRRLIQPVFHQKSLERCADVMRAEAAQLAASWSDGAEIDVTDAMHGLTLRIVGEALFGTNMSAKAERVSELMTTVMNTFMLMISPFGGLLQLLVRNAFAATFRARDELSALVGEIIEKRRASGEQTEDLFGLLFAAQDEETGIGMTGVQLRDEVMTLFLAGHETTANSLSWTLWLLAAHPDILERLRTEVAALDLNDNSQVRDLDDTLLVGVLRESLRLYPPAWIIGRRAIETVRIGSVTIPKDTLVLVCEWSIQRSPRFFRDPQRFDPDRWTQKMRSELPKYAFFPFGGGPRSCIGEGFAWMELAIVLGQLVRDWNFERVPGPKIKPYPTVTLRSNLPIRLRVKRVTDGNL